MTLSLALSLSLSLSLSLFLSFFLSLSLSLSESLSLSLSFSLWVSLQVAIWVSLSTESKDICWGNNQKEMKHLLNLQLNVSRQGQSFDKYIMWELENPQIRVKYQWRKWKEGTSPIPWAVGVDSNKGKLQRLSF